MKKIKYINWSQLWSNPRAKLIEHIFKDIKWIFRTRNFYWGNIRAILLDIYYVIVGIRALPEDEKD